MSTRADDSRRGDSVRRGEPASIATIESYETKDGVVFYDAENPLAWMETSQTYALEDFA
ncbi:hypothetical protein GCM10025298_13130 [Natronobiforma cellulositropha]